jgi:hypothetical protein
MTTKSEIVEQTNLAFDFIQKLYFEVSYLVKEIEGILGEEEEIFVIGRPAGYGISTVRSTGLESNYVMSWMLRKFSVFFVPEDRTKIIGGQTITPLDKNLKVLYFRVLLNDKEIGEPLIYSGPLYDIKKKPDIKWTKFEHAMSHLEFRGDQIFKSIKPVQHEDAYLSLQGELIRNNLYDVNDSEKIVKKIVGPSLRLYRKY